MQLKPELSRYVLAVALDREGSFHVMQALRGKAGVRACEQRDELATMAAAPGVVAVITESRDRAGAPMASTIRALRDGYPTIPVIAYLRLTETPADEILALARAGINELVRRGFDDVGVALRSALLSAQLNCTAGLVRRDLGLAMAAEVREILFYCLDNGHSSLSVTSVAAGLGVDRKTVVNRLRRSGMPTPQTVIGWCRLLMAARLLEDGSRSVENVALSLDFPSGTALRNMLRRYTDLRPSEVRENGGFKCVLHLFRQAVTSSDSGGSTYARSEPQPVVQTPEQVEPAR